MKSTGVIRRIDELGRIVIPKEIRKNLGIREGEALEILIDNDKIILEKHSPLISIENIIESLFNSLKEFLPETVIITNREKVLFSSNKQLINKEISDFNNYIDNREQYVSIELEKHVFDKCEEIGFYSISPILLSSDCFGLIIIISDICNKKNGLLGNFVSKLISKKLDIS